MTVTEFLEARLAEDDEALAHRRIQANMQPEDNARWQGLERGRREVEAKRRLLRAHEDQRALNATQDDDRGLAVEVTYQATLRVLASVYADHPDYREEW